MSLARICPLITGTSGSSSPTITIDVMRFPDGCSVVYLGHGMLGTGAINERGALVPERVRGASLTSAASKEIVG
jgi:hypothetical protein